MRAVLLAVLIAGPAIAGDVENGRRIVENRGLSACLLCHSGPFPAPHLQGTIGPRLDGVGARLTVEELRRHLTGPARFNRDTVMPAYGTVNGLKNVGAAWVGKPILTEAQIEDVVAFLSTLRGP